MSNLSLYELLPALDEVLKLGKEASFVPDGKSMLPFILGGKSEVAVKSPTLPLKKYDIALYTTKSGLLVLHRVIEVRGNGENTTYVLRGDNTYQNEIGVCGEQIVAVVTRFKRKKKWHDAKEKGYLALVKFWCSIYGVRRTIRFLLHLPFRAARKLKRIVFTK